jgi:phage terminase large subunit-like protein
MLDRVARYIADVKSGRVLSCKWVHLAINRHLNDLERAKTDAYPYFFDEKRAQLVLNFITCFRHVSGEWAGQRFEPADFQCFRFAVLFGWRHKESKKRRFRRAYLEVARKQGKSFEAALVQMIGLMIDNEARAEIFSAATTRDQAKIVFETAQDMTRRFITDNDGSGRTLKVMAQAIVNDSTGGRIAALSSDAQKLDGHSPHIAVIDEYHEHSTNKVLKVMETGMGARSQPLSFIITTAGFNIEGPCFRLRKTAQQILEGQKVDETFFTSIHTLDDGDDWKDEKVWIKSNPNIGVSPSWEFMRAEFTKALNEGFEAEVQFKTKNLNIWVSASSTWIQDEKWMKCPEMPDLTGRNSWGGLDLAEMYDFTAFCACFPPPSPDGVYAFKWWFWIAEESAKQMSSRGVNVYDWERDGWITITPGNAVDLDRAITDISKIGPAINLQSIARDPWGSVTNTLKMLEVGMKITDCRQGFRTMSPPMKDFQRLVALGQVAHGGNPVVRWMLSNVEVARDPAGNIKPDRKRKENKIDGIVAAIMALGESLTPVTQGSYLFEREPLIF